MSAGHVRKALDHTCEQMGCEQKESRNARKDEEKMKKKEGKQEGQRQHLGVISAVPTVSVSYCVCV